MSSNDTIYNKWAEELDQLKMQGNFRSLPLIAHDGKWIIPSGKERLLNLSSNDYLGLGADKELMSEFWQQMSAEHLLMTSSSSRLLTGNFDVFEELEALLARLFHKESALVFNCGYHVRFLRFLKFLFLKIPGESQHILSSLYDQDLRLQLRM